MFKAIMKLLGVKEAKRMSHPVFGELLLVEMNDPNKNYWEGEMVIENDAMPIISIAIHASENGPQLAHERFWKKIISDFDAVVAKCYDMMAREYEAWTEKSLPDNFSDELSWEGLTLPQDGDENNDWDISFGFNSDPDHVLTIYFENGKAITASIDG